jgi:Cu(I)/Ag(I) efflux system membrane fusion protein/cobalt-zinc-cadmium efflux system membrane fusion protein
VQVLGGLAAGESVVTSGQFLLDSESNLKEAVQKMLDARLIRSAKKEDDDFFGDME